MPVTDPRRIPGGFVWAKATSVSNDARRIYGVDADKMYLRGVVIEPLTSRPEGAKRATTLIKAKYRVGNVEKIKLINLAQLKKDDPNPAPAPVAAPPPTTTEATTTEATTSPQDSTNNANQEPTTPVPATAAPTVAPPGTVQTQATAGSNSSSVRIPVATVHNRQWFDGETDLPTNGPFVRKAWKLTCQCSGREFSPGCDPHSNLKPIDFFMAVFPSSQLKLMVECTSKKLVEEGSPKVTKGEILKWFGVLLLITRFEFGSRAALWATTSRCKYIPAANFGEKTGMTRDRFAALLRCMVWSEQPPERPEHMSSEQYRWLLVEGFVRNFNEHRSQFFSPSWHLCVDESISRWYGLGGHWINMGLPMYVAIDRKPEDALEIQNSCCAKSGIMAQLKLVKTATANAE